MRDHEEECEEKVTREGRGEVCGKAKGKENGGNGEHARGKFKGEGAATVAGEGEEADEEKEVHECRDGRTVKKKKKKRERSRALCG